MPIFKSYENLSKQPYFVYYNLFKNDILTSCVYYKAYKVN